MQQKLTRAKTEMEVTQNSTKSSNQSEIGMILNVNLDNKFKNYIEHFEVSIKALELDYKILADFKIPSQDSKEKRHQIQEIHQLKIALLGKN